MKKEYEYPKILILIFDENQIFAKLSVENDDYFEEPDNW